MDDLLSFESIKHDLQVFRKEGRLKEEGMLTFRTPGLWNPTGQKDKNTCQSQRSSGHGSTNITDLLLSKTMEKHNVKLIYVYICCNYFQQIREDRFAKQLITKTPAQRVKYLYLPICSLSDVTVKLIYFPFRWFRSIMQRNKTHVRISSRNKRKKAQTATWFALFGRTFTSWI